MKLGDFSQRIFDYESQKWFAELSGDVNPLHLDPIYARRTLLGDVVVHGIHATLWSIEALLEAMVCELRQEERVESQALAKSNPAPIDDSGRTIVLSLPHLARVKAQFLKPIYLNQQVYVGLADQSANGCQLQLVSDSVPRVVINLEFGASVNLLKKVPPAPLSPWPLRQREFSTSKEAVGRMPLYLDSNLARSRYSLSYTSLGEIGMAMLVGLSRLVGMECPGMHSLFSDFALELNVDNTETDLVYRVTRADTPVSLVTMEVFGPCSRGTVKAFYRPTIVAQPTMEEVSKCTELNEFAGQNALIIGGSRGLGETTAKIIASGGGNCAITYHSGEADAQRVAEEIKKYSGHSTLLLHLDVIHPGKGFDELKEKGFVPTHIYYFATPRITRIRHANYQPAWFAEFVEYYVNAFSAIYSIVQAITKDRVIMFYPSTIFIDEGTPANIEYVMAKTAGEALCYNLNRAKGNISIVVKRLKRIGTDQTVTILKSPLEAALPVMLPIIRELSDPSKI
jgi:acyl dehydratase